MIEIIKTFKKTVKKIKVVRAIGQYRILLITAVSAIPLAEKHCHHLRKKVTLKFLNDTEIMCMCQHLYGQQNLMHPHLKNMMTNNIKTHPIHKKSKDFECVPRTLIFAFAHNKSLLCKNIYPYRH